MIAPADPFLEAFVAAGADIVTVHAEAGPHLDRSLARIRELGAKAGVALNPATPPSAVEYVARQVRPRPGDDRQPRLRRPGLPAGDAPEDPRAPRHDRRPPDLAPGRRRHRPRHRRASAARPAPTPSSPAPRSSAAAPPPTPATSPPSAPPAPDPPSPRRDWTSGGRMRKRRGRSPGALPMKSPAACVLPLLLAACGATYEVPAGAVGSRRRGRRALRPGGTPAHGGRLRPRRRPRRAGGRELLPRGERRRPGRLVRLPHPARHRPARCRRTPTSPRARTAAPTSPSASRSSPRCAPTTRSPSCSATR